MTSVRCSVSPTVQRSGTSTLGFTVASVRRCRRHHQPCPPHTLPNKTRRHYRTPAASPEHSHPAACHTGCLCRTDVPRPSRPVPRARPRTTASGRWGLPPPVILSGRFARNATEPSGRRNQHSKRHPTHPRLQAQPHTTPHHTSPDLTIHMPKASRIPIT